VISPSHTPIPTQQTQVTDIHALSGIRTRDLRNLAAADRHYKHGSTVTVRDIPNKMPSALPAVALRRRNNDRDDHGGRKFEGDCGSWILQLTGFDSSSGHGGALIGVFFSTLPHTTTRSREMRMCKSVGVVQRPTTNTREETESANGSQTERVGGRGVDLVSRAWAYPNTGD
jgi:hypothetical protein